ncbi:MAG: hypothetical protein ACPGJS_05505 [Flammeovirgaceae bacterium]
MKTITISKGQNLLDIAIWQYGSAEGVFQLLQDNPQIANLNHIFTPGEQVLIDETQAIREDVVAFWDDVDLAINTTDILPGESLPGDEQENQCEFDGDQFSSAFCNGKVEEELPCDFNEDFNEDYCAAPPQNDDSNDLGAAITFKVNSLVSRILIEGTGTATIDWGDGTVYPFILGQQLQHVYPVNVQWTVKITIPKVNLVTSFIAPNLQMTGSLDFSTFISLKTIDLGGSSNGLVAGPSILLGPSINQDGFRLNLAGNMIGQEVEDLIDNIYAQNLANNIGNRSVNLLGNLKGNEILAASTLTKMTELQSLGWEFLLLYTKTIIETPYTNVATETGA